MIINYHQSTMVLTRCCKRMVLWSLQGVAKDWYYGIQIGASCIFTSESSFPCFMLEEGYRWKYSCSNNIARNWWGRKNHIGTWSSHGNKNLMAMKSINSRVSHQVEELTHWRFYMGGWEFYTEAPGATQALRRTLFWRRGAC